MRNLKKFLALVLAMVMAFSLMLTANAKDIVKDWTDADQIDPAFTEAVDVLSGMGIYQGNGVGFNAAGTITRAEVAALLYRLTTGDVNDVRTKLYTSYGNFTDVSSNDWFAGYVGYCANAGYIKGTSPTTFSPYNKVTGYEVLTMILRAVGYDQNNEFVGGNWQVNVSALGTQLHVLDDVKSTHYGDTLYLASRRDVVASILFAAAQIPTVTWTQLSGYNKYTTPLGIELDSNNKPVLNPSLGYKYFGLASAERVILGNQATGESCTLLGNDTIKWTGSGDKQTHSMDVSYAYPGSQIAKADLTDDTNAQPVDATVSVGDGIKLAEKTGLDLFGHKVKAWYDDRDTGNKTTYAILDKATLTATVQSLNAAGTTADATISTGTKGLGMQAQKAGFSVDLDNSKVWLSDRYNRITNNGADAKPAAGKDSLKADTANTNAKGIYALISNNDSKTLDVVIALQGEVGIIAQKDTTSTTQTLTVGSTDKAIKHKSAFVGIDNTVGKTGILAINSLTDASTQTLGDKVVVWQIIGTNNANTYATFANATGNAGTHRNGNVGTGGENFRYELEKVTTTVSGTVRTYGTNHEITMMDGTTYKQSWFRWLPTGGVGSDSVIGTHDATDNNEAFTIPMDGSYNPLFQAGVTYTIALDKYGNWLGAVPAADKFVYGTFGDFGFGDLGSGTIQYTLTGVDWEGNIVANQKITKMTLDTATTAKDYFDGNAATNQELGDGHVNASYPITKKVLGDVGSSSSGVGSRIVSGSDTGFVVSEDGVLTDGIGGYASKMAATTWTIGKNDVANGFADLAGDGTTLATPKTQFIVVTGTGTDSLSVKIYDSMSEFLGSANYVSINGSGKSSTYYLTEADLYNRYNTDDNKQIAKVIVDARDVTWSGANSLYYLAPGKTAVTNLSLAGNPDPTNIQPYEMWNNGVKGIYWIDIDGTRAGAGIGSPSAGETTAMTGTASTGDFYNLIQISTANGTPIYKAVKALNKVGHTGKTDVPMMDTLANGGICNGNLSYTYVAASELNTGFIGSETFKVTDAVVADLVWTPTSTRTEIKSVDDLNAAISGGYTGIKVAIVNEGVNVSVIYITADT